MKTFANIITFLGILLMLPFLFITLLILAPLYFTFALLTE
jgi:hypothetical protein